MDKRFKLNFLKGSLTASIGTVTSMGFHFLSIMIMTRYLPKEDFGLYVLILAIINFFNLFCGLGLDLTLVKSIASVDDNERKNVLLPVIILRTLFTLLIGIIFYATGQFILHFFSDKINQYIFYIPVLFFLANFRDLFYYLMQGLMLFRKYVTVQISSAIFRIAILFIYLKLNKLSLDNLINIEILATLFPVILQLALIPFKPLIHSRPNVQAYMKIIRFSFPLYMNSLLVFLKDRAPIFIIGAYLNPVSIAYFDVASKIPMALTKIFRSFIIVYVPNLSKLFSQRNKRSASKLINESVMIFSIITTFMALISFLFGKEIVVLIFSKQYLPSSMAFSLLMLNFYFKVMATTMGYSFVPAGYPSIPARISAVACIISIVGSLILVPILGFMGVVYSLIVLNIISMLMYYRYLVKFHLNPNIKKFLQPLVLLIIVIGPYYIISQENIFMKSLCLVLNVALSWFFIEEIRRNLSRFFKFIQNRKWQKKVF